MTAPTEQLPLLLLTVKDAARALAISPRKLWALTNAGEISSVRVGRCVRYDPDDLRDYIERNKNGKMPKR